MEEPSVATMLLFHTDARPGDPNKGVQLSVKGRQSKSVSLLSSGRQRRTQEITSCHPGEGYLRASTEDVSRPVQRRLESGHTSPSCDHREGVSEPAGITTKRRAE